MFIKINKRLQSKTDKQTYQAGLKLYFERAFRLLVNRDIDIVEKKERNLQGPPSLSKSYYLQLKKLFTSK